LFHYVLCFARRASILLYVLVLLSTRAINEQSEERTRGERERERERSERRRRIRERAFLHANATTKVSLVCIFWNMKEKKREKEITNKKNRRVDKKK
jgi:hypothetical protein